MLFKVSCYNNFKLIKKIIIINKERGENKNDNRWIKYQGEKE